jgi:hypothetical protein
MAAHWGRNERVRQSNDMSDVAHRAQSFFGTVAPMGLVKG